MSEKELWTYHCPECGKGFGDMEGKVIKRKYDGFGDESILLRCPRCNALVVTGPGGCTEFEDPEWWGIDTDSEVYKE